MSNYKTKAKRPEGTEFETVDMYDDHYGKHHYGVRFPDGEIFPSEDCEFLPQENTKHICCDGECNHDDCCGKVEENCPNYNAIPEQKEDHLFKIINLINKEK